MSPDGTDIRGGSHAPLSSQMLEVGDGHALYVETVGRRDGVPAVYLHGGPGSGCQPEHRRLFDPDRFYGVLLDQRGAGRSTPKRSRLANHTDALIADMESVRQSLGIKRWMIVGGSWGATLALAYAERHPQCVSGIVLRATFLGTRAELEHAFGDSLRAQYPALHDDFLSVLPESEREAPLDAYWRRILAPDPAINGPVARAWHDTERTLSSAKPGAVRLDLYDIAVSDRMPSTAFMEAHYFANDCFLAPGQLLAGAGLLKDIEGVIVQGSRDLLCPPETARALQATWPRARLEIVENAGHGLQEPGITEAVVAGINALADVR